ncbi:transcription initiation factor IIF, beta subunit [Morchella snyderi]|nr:transcription initiation factor IIF, beta subunit [Morchella snyderi]
MPSIVTIKEENVESESTQRKTLGEKHEVKLDESPSDLNPSIYEETDECDLKHSDQHVWLVRLPAFIRENWNPILSNSEEEVVLGRVMVNKKDASTMKIVLSDEQYVSTGIPRAYNLKPTNSELANTFVFTEKVTLKRKAEEDDELPEIPSRLLRKVHLKGPQGEGVKPTFTRQTIKNSPTALMGTAIAELVMQPVKNNENVEFERRRILNARNLEKRTKYFNKHIDDNAFISKKTGSMTIKPFLKITQPNNLRGKKLDKAYRGSKETIQTKLFDLFEDYEYYSIKLLVEKLDQPEAYLREILEDIAEYTVRGDYAGKWCLKSEYKRKLENS